MALAIVHSRAAVGVVAPPVTVEVDVANGLPALNIVGLPETAVKESKDRVRSAIQNAKLDFPAKRITINLAPADLPKEGGRFDLPIAVGILAATGQVPMATLDTYEFAGELALSGDIRRIRGALPMAIAAGKAGKSLILPKHNADEASLPSHVNVLPVAHLLEVLAHLTGANTIASHRVESAMHLFDDAIDMADVRGQQHARRALEVAAAGQHSLLMKGPPGTGKTMLASRLSSILPPLSEDEALELAAVRSISRGTFDFAHWRIRPFRSPHHTASSAALVGGGRPPQPGEISLAHNGVLFLDELPEFSRHVLDSLREPLESGQVTISRAAHQVQYPAKFQLLAAMNPCPCGYFGDSQDRCNCTLEQIARYQAKISGPLMDRIDIHVTVPKLAKGILANHDSERQETSAEVRERVSEARQRQLNRAGKVNAALSNLDMKLYCRLAKEDSDLLETAMEKMGLSARAYHRILRIARTLADLAGSDDIVRAHLSEALSYRSQSGC